MKKIISGIYRLALMGIVNVYLIEIAGGLWLVDTGTVAHGRRIVKAVNGLAQKCGPLKHIAITHEHADHTGGAAIIQEETGAQLWIHPADAGIFEGDMGVNVTDGLQDGLALPFAPDWRVLHTPGHSPGQCCFYNAKGSVMILGDAVMRWLGRLSLPFKAATVDVAQNIKSVRKLSQLDFEIALFGHGSPIMKGGNKALAELVNRS